MGVVSQADLEFQAWAKSSYSYSDVERLAWYWNQDTYDAKLRVGRKIKWGDFKVLNHMLYNATGQWNWIVKGPYSYNDAVALAEYWGVSEAEAKTLGGHKLSGWLLLNNAIYEAHSKGKGGGKGAKLAFYTVQPGDTLSDIAAWFSTPDKIITPDALFHANSDIITAPDIIHPGQILRIPLF